MFARLGRLAVRRRVFVLTATVAFLVLAGVLGTGVFDKLKGGGFEDPDAESTGAEELLEDEFGAGAPNLVLLASLDGNVDEPDAVDSGTELGERLAAESGVGQVVSYWSLGQVPPLKSTDGDTALLLARVEGDEDAVEKAVNAIREEYTGEQGLFEVSVGGSEAVFQAVSETVEGDLAKAESIAVPITLILLVVVFGSVVAALLPLAVGAIAVLGTFLSLYVISSLTDVSIFSINLTTALGLGLAIDYSLFVVSRFREELAAGLAVEDAVVRTVDTAGRTVAFSALTVAVSLSALLVFPLYFLRSFAYAGIAVVVMAALASLLSLPALLAVLGHRVDSLRLWRLRQPVAGEGFWHRVATTVMRRPIPIATVVIVGLLLLAGPFLGVRFGLPDDRVLPEEKEARQVSESLRDDFAADESEAFGVVARESGDPADDAEAIAEYAATLFAVPGVARVDAMTGSYAAGQQVAPPNAGAGRFGTGEGTWLSVVPGVDPMSSAGEELVHDLRDVPSPLGEVLIGGTGARLVDSKAAIFGQAPLAAGIIAVTTFTLLS